MTMNLTVGFGSPGAVTHGKYRKLTQADISPEGSEWLANQVLAREQKIGEIMAANKNALRIMAAILHDAEHAPIMSQGDVLSRLGLLTDIEIDTNKASDEQVSERLVAIIEGLAFINCFIEGTDRASDRTLLDWLQVRVLREQIRFVPPTKDMSERIDLAACFKGKTKVKRDETLPKFVYEPCADASHLADSINTSKEETK